MTPEKENKPEQPSSSVRPILSIDSSAPLKPRSKLSQAFRKNRKKLLMGAVGLIVIAGLGFGLSQLFGKHYVFTVNGKGYTRSEVDAYTKPIMELTKKSEKEATDLLYDSLKVIEVAKALNKEPTDEQVSNEFSLVPNILGQSQEVQAWKKLEIKALLAKNTTEYLKQNNASAAGFAYIFRFGENIESGPSYKAPGFGNAKLINADKQYAKSRAENYHKKLLEKAITPDVALNEIKADARLGYFGKPNTNQSVRFTEDDVPLQRYVVTSDVAKFIESQKEAGVTDIQTGKTAFVEEPQKDSDWAETYYYFALIERPSSKASDFQKRFEEVSKKIESASKRGN